VTGAPLPSRIDLDDADFHANALAMAAKLDEVNGLHAQVLLGGGEAAIQRQRSRDKLLARERLEALVDPGTPVLELSPLAGMHTDDPLGGGLVVALGEVAGTQCLVIANDPTVRAGTTSPTTIAKLLRAMDVAETNRLPLVLLVESGGADLPRQADVFVPGGEQFRRLTQLSAAGIPTVCVVFGSSTAGGAYLPGMSDYTIFVEGRAKVFLGGPPLVKMAIGEDADEEELGGASMHARVSGLCDYLAPDERSAISQARTVISHLHSAMTPTSCWVWRRRTSGCPSTCGRCWPGCWTVRASKSSRPTSGSS
jgi:acetyl-CoA carboxylase carboxyltransferase component